MNKILLIVAVLIGLSLAFIVNPKRADAGTVMVDEHTLAITGTTNQFMATKVSIFMEQNDVKRVVMWGEGGDFFAGLSIGYYLKKKGVTIQIPTGRRCVSSCAFAALSAEKLMLGGELWLHRPYRPTYSPETSLADIETDAQGAGMHQAHYFYHMDLPIRFLQEVIAETNQCSYYVIDSSLAINKFMSGGYDSDGWSNGFARRLKDDCDKL